MIPGDGLLEWLGIGCAVVVGLVVVVSLWAWMRRVASAFDREMIAHWDGAATDLGLRHAPDRKWATGRIRGQVRGYGVHVGVRVMNKGPGTDYVLAMPGLGRGLQVRRWNAVERREGGQASGDSDFDREYRVVADDEFDAMWFVERAAVLLRDRPTGVHLERIDDERIVCYEVTRARRERILQVLRWMMALADACQEEDHR